jgi:hypothetical protein
MNNREKGILLKDTITKLYQNEGRSISYINRLLNIDRHTISILVHEWGLYHGNHLKTKRKEFLASYKPFVVAKLKAGWTQRQIYTACHVGRFFFLNVVEHDKDIQNAMKSVSYKGKVPQEVIADEVWSQIWGFENYEISNYGRCRNKYGILKTMVNPISGYVTVGLYKDGKLSQHRVHRLVAHAFCAGYSEERNQVNHIDGNILNNKSSNLEWVSASENTQHSYDVLGRIHKSGGGVLPFIIEYDGKYRFKTIAAFARFIEKSPTQAARYVYESPEEHNINKIPKKSNSVSTIVTTIS